MNADEQQSALNTVSFDRMRSMLVRAAEIRDSEQQQVFDALDEIHERLGEAMGKLEAQDTAIASLARAVESAVDRLGQLAGSQEKILALLNQFVVPETDERAMPSESGSRELDVSRLFHTKATGPVSAVTNDPFVDWVLHHAGEESERRAGPSPSVETLLEGAWEGELSAATEDDDVGPCRRR